MKKKKQKYSLIGALAVLLVSALAKYVTGTGVGNPEAQPDVTEPQTTENPLIENPESEPSASVSASPTEENADVQTYAVAFYNVENLFDAQDDPAINDEDFLPNGMYQWDEKKYRDKVQNMSRVLADIATNQLPNQGASLIGLAEVENRGVVEALLRTNYLKSRGYRILHFDSPDTRGIDCALLYNPKVFRLEDSLYVQNITPRSKNDDWLGFTQDPKTQRITARPRFGDTSHPTRGFLVGIGTMAGEKMAIIVNHWPSRGSESFTRERSARQVKKLIEALLLQYPGIKVIMMGDLNDDPDNKSMKESMMCCYYPSKVKDDGDIFNPWKYMLRDREQGTLVFKGEWNLFDQIVMTGNLIDRKMYLDEKKPDISKMNLANGLTFYYNEIVVRDYMSMMRDGKRVPKRSIVNGEWKNGYSDHFPTCIYLIKRK